jgi:hypothetical protein
VIISDLQHIEFASNAKVNGGASATTGINVSAYGGKATANAYGSAFGDNTGANSLVGTRSAAGDHYDLSAATAATTAYAVTIDGKNSRVDTSYSTGVATNVRIY